MASGLGQTAATLGAGVNPNGTAVSDCHFEYGTSVFYESSQPCSALPGSGTGSVSVSAHVEGLSANTSYHFRIVAGNEGGTSYGADHGFTTLPNPPSVTKVSPGSGPVGGGTTITISGANLARATAVTFGATTASTFTVTSATSLSAVSPTEPAGAVDVTVTTPGGTSAISSADRFRFSPTVTGVSPNSGPTAGGMVVAITGTGFAAGTGATKFEFGSLKAASVDCSSSTECIAVSPAHEAGTVDVRAIVNKTTSARNTPADQFTYS